MTTQPFNLNNYVRVRLTDRVWQVLRRQRDELNVAVVACGGRPVDAPVVTEIDGWSRWQLWELMRNFGSLCVMGYELPFATDIVLEIE
jgi:hypothetical protein